MSKPSDHSLDQHEAQHESTPWDRTLDLIDAQRSELDIEQVLAWRAQLGALDNTEECLLELDMFLGGLATEDLERHAERLRQLRPPLLAAHESDSGQCDASPGEPRLPRAGDGRRSGWGWLRLAAAILITFATGLAVGSEIQRSSVAVVGSGSVQEGRVAEAVLRSRLDFKGAGVPLEARILGLSSFLDTRGRLGTAAVVEVQPSSRLDLVAFDGEGSVLWVASRDWPDFTTTLGFSGVRLTALKTLVGETKSRGRMVEALALVLERRTRSCVVLVTPTSGERRGTHFFAGVYSAESEGLETLTVLPAPVGVSRRLLLAGQIREGPEATPSLCILTGDGDLEQVVSFPVPGRMGRFTDKLEQVLVDWSRSPPEVSLLSDRGTVYYALMKRDGETLDVSSVKVLAHDQSPAALVQVVQPEPVQGWRE